MTITFRKLILILCVICFAAITIGLCTFVIAEMGNTPELAFHNAYKATKGISAVGCTMMIIVFSCTIFYDIVDGNLK